MAKSKKQRKSGVTEIDVTGKRKSKIKAEPRKSKTVLQDGKSVFPLVGKSITDTGVADFTRDALSIYGAYVVEDRAVPDYRDGLAPVHRSLLWSLAGLGLRPSAGYKKSARTVGDCIGKYHPHGDAAAYGAMTTIANTMPPLVDGQGNWGTPVNTQAAMRYTEARMSRFAHAFMLDSKYLEVVPKIPNFSGDDTIPLFLPALLPYAMFKGNIPAPAYGVSAGNPAFSFRSVAKIVIGMLKGKKVGPKSMVKALKIEHPWGCLDVTESDEYAHMIKTGKGTITYAPLIEEDFDKKTILVRSFVPIRLSSHKSIDKTLEKISAMPGVRKCYSKQGKKSKGSGPYGALFIIECQRNITHDQYQDVLEDLEAATTSKVGYRLGITVRKAEERNAFRYLGYVKFFEAWIKYRIALEVRMIKHLIVKAERDLHLNEVYLWAVENMEELLDTMKKVLLQKDPTEALMKAMKLSREDAEIIMDRKMRQLARLEAADLKAKIKELRDEIKGLKADLQDPGARAARDTKERVQAYLKKPDNNKSGLTV